MARRGKRVRVATGIFRDLAGYSIIVAGKEIRAPLDTSDANLLRKRADLLEQIAKEHPARLAAPGTLLRDLPKFEQLIQHLTDPGAQLAHLKAWMPKYGHLPRYRLTREDVLTTRGEWLKAGVKPKTINNRVSALRALFHALDGDDAPTPCDRLKPIKRPREPIAYVRPEIILAVERELKAREQQGFLRDQKTRARFRVLAVSGVRASELMRAQPGDIDWARKVWAVRTGKGGYRPVGLPIIEDVRQALALFVHADAFGAFDTGSMARALREAGWPAHIRPYQLRHSVGIALSEAGVDLADISLILGHALAGMTRTHYVPPEWKRIVAAMQTIDGRLRFDVEPPMEPASKSKRTR